MFGSFRERALQRDLRMMADELGRTFWIACEALAARAMKGTPQLAEVVSSAYECFVSV